MTAAQAEKEILDALEAQGPLTVQELFDRVTEEGLDEEEFSTALGRLIGRGLVKLSGDQDLDVPEEVEEKSETVVG